MRAKLTVQSVTKHAYGAEEVKLNAVYSADKNDPNYSWSQATPRAELSITISNPDAMGKFEPGKSYFVDFTEAE